MTTVTKKYFSATIQKEGKFTFVSIPFSPPEVWGVKPRYQVTGTINGVSVRGTLGALGQDYFLRLGAAWMRDSEMEIGAKVKVELALEGPQENNIAPNIAKALTTNKKAQAFFEGLSTYYRKNFIRWIESAKREETRSKRISEMIRLLEAGKREK